MTLRLPEDLDRQLEEIAADRHTSKHALIIEATARFAAQNSKTDRVLAAIDEIGVAYADTIKRLEDA
jgi:Ribbon-helix-helix protein, copG family.